MRQYDFKTFLSVRSTYGSEIRALCPFHDDRSPSFNANVETGLWICHAGCGQGNYGTFLKSMKRGACVADNSGSVRSKGETREVEDWSLFSKIDEYIYFDLNQGPRLRVTRFETSDGKEKRFAQEHLNKKGFWVNGGVGALGLLPYRFEDWGIFTEPLLFVVEGEKCVRFLIGLGFQATTFVGGANGWKSHYSQYFKGRYVIILPDNDEPGMKFAEEALNGIQAITPVRIVTLPDLGVGEDVFDWFKRGGTVTEFRNLMSI